MIEAVVQTGAFETTYRRAGRGAPVMLLDRAGAAGDGDWLFEGLAARFRTIGTVVPDAAHGGDPRATQVLEAWLRGLIDGLGLERPAVVASAAHGGALLRFAGIDPERIGRLVLLRDGGEAPWPAEALASDDRPAGDAPHPVLFCRRPAGEPAELALALSEIVEFLARAR